MAGINQEYLKEHKLFRRRNKNIIAILPLSAIIITFVVFWCLKLVGITVTYDALCEVEEHNHIGICYSNGELICTKPEHTHSAECFPETDIDVETPNDWKTSIEKAKITNNVAENLISVAVTQVGYKESLENYEYNALAEKHSYTRYGEWYGSPYGEWNTMFVSFCINYANINNSDLLISASAENMRCAWAEKNLYYSADTYSGSRGDVVFFDTNSDQKADRTAIVISKSEDILIVIEGNVDGAVNEVVYQNFDNVLGYGKTSNLYELEHFVDSPKEYATEGSVTTPELSGRINKYIPSMEEKPVMFKMTKNPPVTYIYDSESLMLMNYTDDDYDIDEEFTLDEGIIFTSDLEQEIIHASIKTLSGVELSDGATVYLGETYLVSLGFSEINSGDHWVQFNHNEDGFLTYQLPSNLNCQPFDEWHTISAKTENGTMSDVGEYYLDETGLLKVRFYEDQNGVNFVDKYSNVDFTIDFHATVAEFEAGNSTEIEFNDKLNLNFVVDGNATMNVVKTHGKYNSDDNTMEYTVKVEATHGVVKDLVVNDEIWENHYTLRDTIVVTDLDGNIIDPQPIISDHPSHSSGANEGFSISGFPDFSAGNGFLITYKTQIYDNLLSSEAVDMWNGVYAYGVNALNGYVDVWNEDWQKLQLERIKKKGKQAVLTDNNGNSVDVIEWIVEIKKNNTDLFGTIVTDTLGNGLDYYKDTPIRIVRYDAWGNLLPDAYISWNDVTINGNSMSFPLPTGHSFAITYYTTYDEAINGNSVNYTNSVKATINGKEEYAGGSAEVVGFVPNVSKIARGDDGEYIYFTIEADVPATIKDVGGFFLTDFPEFWNYSNATGTLFIENIPEDMVITATTESGKTIDFTPYKEGGTIENTYILVAPAIEDDKYQMHSFKVFFNTSEPNPESSKWILSEASSLKVSYKIPFDAKTGTEWYGDLTGDLTVGEVLLQGYKLSNNAYLNYTPTISGVGTTDYDYSPKITKNSTVNEDGIIDYTVVFNNSIPGTNGDEGYINRNIAQMWFTDTFDERLEYVPNSLVVTGYSPWNKEMWLAKYQYTGTVTGNTIEALADDFTFINYNQAVDPVKWNKIPNTVTFKDYYNEVNAGGRFVFTYKLKVKDEYLYTTDYAKFELDNTAEVKWDNDGSSGPVTETSEFYTGLLHKHVNQDNEKLDFQVHINRKALDIIEGVDTLTVVM